MKRPIVQMMMAVIITAVSVCPPVFQKPSFSQSIQRPQAKCGDGICDEFEKVNPNLCPKDCREWQECVQEGKDLGPVYPGNTKQCCEGLTPYIPPGKIGTKGICVKFSTASAPKSKEQINKDVLLCPLSISHGKSDKRHGAQLNYLENAGNRFVEDKTQKDIYRHQGEHYPQEDLANVSRNVARTFYPPHQSINHSHGRLQLTWGEALANTSPHQATLLQF